MSRKVLVIILLLMVLAAGNPSKSYAFLGESTTKASGSGASRGPNLEKREVELKIKEQNQKKQRASREGELKTKQCEERQALFTKRLEARPKIALKMVGLFDSILKRTEDFYTNKVVPAGGSVVNYTALVADTAVKRVALETAVTSLKNSAPTFDCSQPKTRDDALGTKKHLLENVKTAIKHYRESVRVLVKAVRAEALKVLSEKVESGNANETN